jgi:hypothetical protein
MAGWRGPDCRVARRPGLLDGRLLNQSLVSRTRCTASSAMRRRAGTYMQDGWAVLYNRVILSRSAFPTTLTDDSAIAAAAMIGDSNRPNAG